MKKGAAGASARAFGHSKEARAGRPTLGSFEEAWQPMKHFFKNHPLARYFSIVFAIYVAATLFWYVALYGPTVFFGIEPPAGLLW